MPFFILVLSLTLVLSSAADAADYIVSSSTAVRERALTWEANRSGKTKQAVLQDLVDQYLNDRSEQIKGARAEALRKGYEAASPTDKATINALIPNVP